jgi:hypothetical protein
MAARRPLVSVNGTLQEMPSGDTLASDTYSASGATVGRVSVDFGAFPGTVYATLTITGIASIVATSRINVWVDGTTATADHTTGEHIVDAPGVSASDIVVGVGFTIHAFSNNAFPHHGLFSVCYEIT